MDRIKAFFNQKRRRLWRNGYVYKEFHHRLASFSRGRNCFFSAKPSCILNCLLYIFMFKVRVVFEYILSSFFSSQKIQNLVYWKPHSSNARLSMENIWVNSNAFKHIIKPPTSKYNIVADECQVEEITHNRSSMRQHAEITHNRLD